MCHPFLAIEKIQSPLDSGVVLDGDQHGSSFGHP
jgi:hypothetical protein